MLKENCLRFFLLRGNYLFAGLIAGCLSFKEFYLKNLDYLEIYQLSGLIYFFQINNRLNVTAQLYHFHLNFHPCCQLDQIYSILETYYLYLVKFSYSSNNFLILCNFNHDHKNQILLTLPHYYFSNFMKCFILVFKKYFCSNIFLKIFKSFYHFIF